MRTDMLLGKWPPGRIEMADFKRKGTFRGHTKRVGAKALIVLVNCWYQRVNQEARSLYNRLLGFGYRVPEPHQIHFRETVQKRAGGQIR